MGGRAEGVQIGTTDDSASHRLSFMVNYAPVPSFSFEKNYNLAHPDRNLARVPAIFCHVVFHLPSVVTIS